MGQTQTHFAFDFERFNRDALETNSLDRKRFSAKNWDLAAVVYEYLDYIVAGIEKPSEQYTCRQPCDDTASMDERILATLGNCINMPYFHLILDDHSLEEWFRLYSAAMQCGLEPCDGTGWIMVSIRSLENAGHRVALYFNRERKVQYFFSRGLFFKPDPRRRPISSLSDGSV